VGRLSWLVGAAEFPLCRDDAGKWGWAADSKPQQPWRTGLGRLLLLAVGLLLALLLNWQITAQHGARALRAIAESQRLALSEMQHTQERSLVQQQPSLPPELATLPRSQVSAAPTRSSSCAPSTSVAPVPVRVAFFTIALGRPYARMAIEQAHAVHTFFCGTPTQRRLVEAYSVVFSNYNYSTVYTAEERQRLQQPGDVVGDSTTPPAAVTDDKPPGSSVLPPPPRTLFVHKEKRGWPHDSETRFQFILELIDQDAIEQEWSNGNEAEDQGAVKEEERANSALPPTRWSEFDYLYWMDVDHTLVAPTCFDLLADLTAVQHWLYDDPRVRPWPYEARPISAAFVNASEWQYKQPYYSAHLFGGSYSSMVSLLRGCHLSQSLDHSASPPLRARVDDESHLTEHAPSVILGRTFLEPEGKTRMHWHASSEEQET